MLDVFDTCMEMDLLWLWDTLHWCTWYDGYTFSRS